jgi:hypothetical protein
MPSSTTAKARPADGASAWRRSRADPPTPRTA